MFRSVRFRLEIDEHDLVALIAAAVADLRPLADQAQLTSHLDASVNRCPVALDPGRLQQVVTNLMANAVRFAQADPSAPASATGTGLGLAISRDLIEAMGGSIRCDSERGCTEFRFTVPTATPG